MFFFPKKTPFLLKFHNFEQKHPPINIISAKFEVFNNTKTANFVT